MLWIKKKRTAPRHQSCKSVIPFKYMIVKAHLWKTKRLNNHLKSIANLCFIFTQLCQHIRVKTKSSTVKGKMVFPEKLTIQIDEIEKA